MSISVAVTGDRLSALALEEIEVRPRIGPLDMGVEEPGVAAVGRRHGRAPILQPGLDLGLRTFLRTGQREGEGGENGFVHKLPGRLEYDDIKLTRPVDQHSGELATWFTGYQDAVRKQQRLEMVTASITARLRSSFPGASNTATKSRNSTM